MHIDLWLFIITCVIYFIMIFDQFSWLCLETPIYKSPKPRYYQWHLSIVTNALDKRHCKGRGGVEGRMSKLSFGAKFRLIFPHFREQCCWTLQYYCVYIWYRHAWLLIFRISESSFFRAWRLIKSGKLHDPCDVGNNGKGSRGNLCSNLFEYISFHDYSDSSVIQLVERIIHIHISKWQAILQYVEAAWTFTEDMQIMTESQNRTYINFVKLNSDGCSAGT